MNPENQKKLQEYARGIAEILYQEAAPEDLASLGDIEKTIRQQTLDYVTPQLGIFLSKKGSKSILSEQTYQASFKVFRSGTHNEV